MAGVDFSRIRTNIGALQALNALNGINRKLAIHQTRLATGKRINSASDDAAGFSIATKLGVRAEGLGAALNNIADAKNLITVAEGHLNNINDILAQMKTKASEAANDTLGTEERAAIQAELQQLASQIDLEVEQAQWNGNTLFKNATDEFVFQIGAGTTSTDRLTFDLRDSSNVSFSGGNNAYTSTGLRVNAGDATRSVSATTLSTDYSANSIATESSTVNATLGQFSTGHYTIEVTSTGATTSATITIRVRDSEGNLVNIDSDGDGVGDYGTALTTTVSSTDPSALNLGRGLTIDLAGVATASGTTEGALYSVDYTASGNPVNTAANARAYMSKVDTAIDDVSEALSYIGATFNRLTFQEESLTVARTNTQAAHNRIMNADMAYEQLEATKLQILQQTATAMLAQANVAPQSVLSLFR